MERASTSFFWVGRILEGPLSRGPGPGWTLTSTTVELIPTLGALPPRGGPVQDPVLTRRKRQVYRNAIDRAWAEIVAAGGGVKALTPNSQALNPTPQTAGIFFLSTLKPKDE